MEHSDDRILSWKDQILDQNEWKEMHLTQQDQVRE